MRIVAACVLVVLGACCTTPEPVTCKLVGTWNDEKSRQSNSPMWETFDADGVLTLTTIDSYGKRSEYESRWKLLQEWDDRVTIAMLNPQWAAMWSVRTFVFESPNLIHEEDGMLDIGKYTRVPPHEAAVE